MTDLVLPPRPPRTDIIGDEPAIATYAGAGAMVPIVYGTSRVPPTLARLGTYDNDLVMLLVWCLGEVDEVVEVYHSDGTVPSDAVTFTHYTGTTTQTTDATLAAAFDGWANDLVDSIQGETVGLCYSVAVVPPGIYSGIPQYVAEIKGKKVYDPRDVGQSEGTPSTWLYSDNPALCLADFEGSAIYGRNRDVNWTSVEDVADDNDELVNGQEKRRLIGLRIDTRAEVAKWSETLRAYAGCFIVPRGDEVRLVSDRPGSSQASLTDADIVADRRGRPDFKMQIRGTRQAPTVVCIAYTDTSATQWRTAYAYAKAAGVDAGTLEWRESRIALPGISRYSQAYREALERLNSFTLTDLSVKFQTHDEALAFEVGDLIDITFSRGLTAKVFRVTEIAPKSPGRWMIGAVEYQSNVYSDSIEAAPTFTDTDLPSPFEIDDIAGLTATEEIFQLQTGIYSSRLRVSWTATTYPYFDTYQVEMYVGSNLVFTALTKTNSFVSPAVQEGVQHKIQVRIVSTLGVNGDWALYYVTPQGKYLPPGNVPSITGFEVGGEVRLSWTAAVDIDIWRYELRYGSTGGTWANATFIDRVDALRHITREIPAGTWDIHVKAIDSVGGYSTNSTTVEVEVTTDANAYFVDMNEFSSPSLTNVRAFNLTRHDGITRYVTEADAGDSISSMFPNAMSTYTNALVTYHSSVSGEWLSETYDFGSQITGNWSAEIDVTAVSGTVTSYLEISTDAASWDQYATLAAKDTARYARVRIQTSTTSTMLVTVPTVLVRVIAVPREEAGTDTSLATGGKTITLSGEYSSALSVQITPIGTGDLVAVVDSVSPGATSTFDVYIFDGGTQSAEDFYWNWKGV